CARWYRCSSPLVSVSYSHRRPLGDARSRIDTCPRRHARTEPTSPGAGPARSPRLSPRVRGLPLGILPAEGPFRVPVTEQQQQLVAGTARDLFEVRQQGPFGVGDSDDAATGLVVDAAPGRGGARGGARGGHRAQLCSFGDADAVIERDLVP